MSEVKVPGIVYSLILAVATWATTYFATGNPGGEYVWAPILLATIPTLLKFIVVAASPSEPAAASRGFGDAPAQRSRISKLLLG